MFGGNSGRIERLFMMVLAVSISACATRYGHKLTQSSVDVQSTPKGSVFWLIDEKIDKQLNPEKTLVVRDDAFDRYWGFIRNKHGLSSFANSTPVVTEVGLNVVIIRCGAFLKRYPVNVLKNEKAVVSVACEHQSKKQE